MATEYELGLLVGLLIGEGHFGGDGKQPQITLRMHVRHEALFLWLDTTFPGGKLYGPYDHSGRRYYQWMARGSFLRDELVPLIASRIVPELDAHAYVRFTQMRTRYASQLGTRSPSSRDLVLEEPRPVSPGPSDASGEAEPEQVVESSESILSQAESIFSRMREEGTSEGSGG